MASDSGYPDISMELLAKQLRHDAQQRLLQRADDLFADGIKGLALLNSGAAVAILGFFAALAGKSTFPHLIEGVKLLEIVSLGLFLFGALLASLVFWPRRRQIINEYYEDKKKTCATWVTYLMLGISVACFAIGSTCAACGIWRVW